MRYQMPFPLRCQLASELLDRKRTVHGLFDWRAVSGQTVWVNRASAGERGLSHEFHPHTAMALTGMNDERMA